MTKRNLNRDLEQEIERAIKAEAEVIRLREVIDASYTFLPIDPKRAVDLLRREFIDEGRAEPWAQDQSI